MSIKAYGRELDYFVITRALANFQRTLISKDSPFDQFYFDHENDALNLSAKRGMELFFSEKLACTQCHSGPNFTNYSFQNNGRYEVYYDKGRFRLTGDQNDLALFKVPSLRNLKYTAPYMHDGSIQSLDEVIDHYNAGGFNHFNKSEHVKPLDT